jgi:GT2 family glycosyltransferase
VTSLAIGVVSFERGALTQRLLDSLAETTETSYHVFVADNGSTEARTRTLLTSWETRPDTTVIRLQSNTGPSGGRNAILERAGAGFDAIAMLDNDIVALPGWDAAALGALARGYDAVAPKLLTLDRTVVDRGPMRAWKEGFLLHPQYLGRGASRHAPEVTERCEVPIVGGTAVFRADVFRRAGFYDPRVWIGEDYELAYRARAAGFRFCYEPSCELVHDHPYEPSYEQVRVDPRRSLASHYAIWKRHRRLLLSPASLWLHGRVVGSNEPMFLERRLAPLPLYRRVRRRAWRWYASRSLGEVWSSEEEGARATERSETIHGSFCG